MWRWDWIISQKSNIMWKLNNITAQNVCAFRELDYTLEQGVTTLVFGSNQDNESQQSNGSGKSALIECIALGITGTPLRKVRADEIINDNAEACCVTLEFYNEAADEVFTVRREVFRKGSSVVSCRIERDGREVLTDEAMQPSVEGYNRYILEKLGITRDELLNNFLLSRYRYQDFLLAPDKEKKEIINRFSNGTLVDQAIEWIQEDIAPLEEGVRTASLEMAAMDGRIRMLTEQIGREESNQKEKQRTKEERIASIRQTVTEKRVLVRQHQDQLAQARGLSRALDEADNSLQRIENSGLGLEECNAGILALLDGLVGEKPTDWAGVVETKKQEIADARQQVAVLETVIGRTADRIGTATAALLALQSEYKVFEGESAEKDAQYREELAGLEEKIAGITDDTNALKRTRRVITQSVEHLQNQLAGTITCPACKHEFLVSDKGFDAVTARKDLETGEETLSSLAGQILDGELEIEKGDQIRTYLKHELRGLTDSRAAWEGRLAAARRTLQSAEYEMEAHDANLKHLRECIATRSKEIADLRGRMFDEAFAAIDDQNAANERRINACNEEMAAAHSSVETLEGTIRELEASPGDELAASLREALKECRKESSAILERKNGIEAAHRTLAGQKERFVLFKSYLANTKIEALGRMVNAILADLGSDIRIQFGGYTALKTGGTREKISVGILRDGVDIGSFGKCSAGENARLGLAVILAMQQLVNSACEEERGLDLIVIDELLDSMDESGLACTFSAMNRLGVTALVVSHGNIAEGYAHRLLIRKANGESRIVQ